MTDDTNQTEAAATPAEDQPKPGYRRIAIPASTLEVKIEPDPIADQVFGYVGREADQFDQFARRLYVQAGKVLERLRRADGSYRSDDDMTPPDREAADAAQLEYDAIFCAISNLRQAAEALRTAKLALAPYVDPKLIERKY